MHCILFLLITAAIFVDASDATSDFVPEEMESPLNIRSKPLPEMADLSSEGFAQGMDYVSRDIKNTHPVTVKDTHQSPFDFSAEDIPDPAMYRDGGCRRTLLSKSERSCLDKFETSVAESQSIRDDREKTRKICCVIVDYEKCSFRGYEEANCYVDKDEVRNNILATAPFMTFFVSKHACTVFRGQCHLLSSSRAITLSWLALLPFGLMLL
ncbi:uncharacterized protein LOC118196457 isoform X2 [Stegodyphus dumicola]|uniref:uncharacterized protein LOC118196457 isoform X2 n=1 Tax=Stegodyphus dumicola TaxID=202533 RepID=UPI0015AF45FC|nr:uncharacterized protein LOC118196457 isoform X2 [Stegodyphus dumicola]